MKGNGVMTVTPVTNDEAIAERPAGTTKNSAAVQRLIELVRKHMCHLPKYTHAEINEAIADVEKGQRNV